MDWKALDREDQIEEIIALSQDKPQIILKHSTTCSISGMVKSRLERSEIVEEADYYLLDLLSYRAVSNLVADKFGVHHESPQVLVIAKGKCIYNESHYGIMADEILSSVSTI